MRQKIKIQDNRKYKRRDWVIDTICAVVIFIVPVAIWLAVKG